MLAGFPNGGRHGQIQIGNNPLLERKNFLTRGYRKSDTKSAASSVLCQTVSRQISRSSSILAVPTVRIT